MPIQKPYKRIYRNYLNNFFKNHDYIIDKRNLTDIQSNAHAYHLIEEDLKIILNYVSPSDNNLKTYSHKIYELYLRTCTEFENNATALLKANGYTKAKMNIKDDYFKINKALKLNEYELRLDIWQNFPKIIKPFEAWSSATYVPLTWYQDYNSVKHDRTTNFHLANLDNLLSAVAGLAAILFGQFEVQAYSPFIYHSSSPIEGIYSLPACIFHIKPYNWEDEEIYDFDWDVLKNETNPFQQFNF